MAVKKVCICFDYEKDRSYRYLLSALTANSRNDLTFDDKTPGEISSEDISRIKGVLTARIRQATHVLVLIGEDANKRHKDHKEIGETNWQHWEIKKSVEEKKKLLAVKLDASYDYPEPLYGVGAVGINSFNVEGIIEALDKA